MNLEGQDLTVHDPRFHSITLAAYTFFFSFKTRLKHLPNAVENQVQNEHMLKEKMLNFVLILIE